MQLHFNILCNNPHACTNFKNKLFIFACVIGYLNYSTHLTKISVICNFLAELYKNASFKTIFISVCSDLSVTL